MAFQNVHIKQEQKEKDTENSYPNLTSLFEQANQKKDFSSTGKENFIGEIEDFLGCENSKIPITEHNKNHTEFVGAALHSANAHRNSDALFKANAYQHHDEHHNVDTYHYSDILSGEDTHYNITASPSYSLPSDTNHISLDYDKCKEQTSGVKKENEQLKSASAPKLTSSITKPSTNPTSSTPIFQAEEILQIPISQIVPNPNQPRKDFSEPSIIKLADSIRQYGIIQPLTVRKIGQLYELVAGERRLRALKELQIPTAPCVLVKTTDVQSAEIAIIENLMRENLNIFEQALAIESLIDTYCLTQEQVAERLSSSQSNVANKLRLLRFSKDEREIILASSLTERHARALLRVNDENLRKNLLNATIAKGFNVQETENLVLDTLNAGKNQQNAPKENKPYKDITSFYNAVKRALNCAKTSNLNIKSRKIIGESFTEITIILPNEAISDDEDNEANTIVRADTEA